MLQPPDGAGLPLEPVQPVRIVGQLVRKDLDGDGPVEAGVLGPVDDSHTALAKFSDDAVVAQHAQQDAAGRHPAHLDAAADTPPGEVRCRPLQPDASALSTMAHFHDPRELLAWCEALYGEAPAAWLICVPITEDMLW